MMKKNIFWITILFLFCCINSYSKGIPSVKIKSIRGNMIDANSLQEKGQSILLLFFASCCTPSLNALKDLSVVNDDWTKLYNLKIITISVDDMRNSKKVAPLFSSRKWSFDVYLDENGDFRRAMGVIDKPHYILFNKNGESIYEHIGYSSGLISEIETKLKSMGLRNE